MYLKKIILADFKNIETAQAEFSPKFNCITGDNGSGKTNLLDAIWCLSMTKSFFQLTDRQIVRHDREAAAVNGTFIDSGSNSHTVALSVRGKGDKLLKYDGKSCRRLSDHIGRIPTVMVSPSDSSLVSEGGEARRRFLNCILSQTDSAYLRSLIAYNKLLLQRNSLLKDEYVQRDLLDTVTVQMDAHATRIYRARRKLCGDLLPLLSRYYGRISGGAEAVSMKYRSDLDEATFLMSAANDFERDRLLKFTLRGIHRDEVDFLLDGYSIRRFGSQGQQKSFLTALKLAQFSLMRDSYGFPPILLLDDLFDRLDSKRVEALLELVSDESFGQIFITDSNKVRIGSTIDRLGADSVFLTVRGGEIQPAENEER